MRAATITRRGRRENPPPPRPTTPRTRNPRRPRPHHPKHPTHKKRGGRPQATPQHNPPTTQNKRGGRQKTTPSPKKTVAATYSPTPPQGSTISAKRLNDRVRNETGCDPPAITTTETKRPPQPQQRSHDSQAFVKNVREQPNYLQRTSPRPISTGQLHPSQGFHTRPINPVVYRGPYPLKGGRRPHLEASFPLRCFQRLSIPNVANQPCPWQDNWHTRGSSVPVLSY